MMGWFETTSSKLIEKSLCSEKRKESTMAAYHLSQLDFIPLIYTDIKVKS